jgi:cell division transport system ATP-binding protein
MAEYVIHLSNGQLYLQKGLALTGISLKVRHGEFVYLTGKTGSGKTTLLRALYGDLPYKEGKGFVAGFDLKKLTSKKIPYLRRKIGIIFQDFHLLTDRSVRDNLLFVLKATGWKNKQLIERRIEDVLKLVQLDSKAHKMPHELSGGEQQKLVIARALLNEPLLVLADEPTGNLDPDISEEVVRLLMEISRGGAAVVMATHDYRLIEKFPARVVRVENNTIEELNAE